MHTSYVVVFLAAFACAIDDDESFNPENVRPLLELLRNFGKNYLNNLNKENVNQVLTVCMISEDELRDSKDWSSIPEHFLNSNLVRSFENVDSSDHKKALHGEVQFLYDDDKMPQMLKTFRNQHQDKPPIVAMFSTYIPCSLIKGCTYSCSEELASVALSEKLKMLIGYQDVHDLTNEEKSKAYLREGCTRTLQLNDNGIKEVYEYQIMPSSTGTFQKHFHECLYDSAFTSLCTPEPTEDRGRISAIFVNTATKACTENSGDRGALTRYNRRNLLNCLKNYVKNNIKDDCTHGHYSVLAIRNAINVCAYIASTYNTLQLLGKAIRADDTNWEEFDGPWKYLYDSNSYVDSEQINHISCSVINMDITKLCQTIKNLPKKRPEAFADDPLYVQAAGQKQNLKVKKLPKPTQ